MSVNTDHLDKDASMLIRPPLVPAKLRELLTDYPEYVELLQKAINKAAAESPPSAPRIELIVWGVEDCLDGFVFNAKDELDAAKASGDADAIARAEAKELLMHRARLKQVWMRDVGLLDYIQRDKEAVR